VRDRAGVHRAADIGGAHKLARVERFDDGTNTTALRLIAHFDCSRWETTGILASGHRYALGRARPSAWRARGGLKRLGSAGGPCLSRTAVAVCEARRAAWMPSMYRGPDGDPETPR